MPFHLSTAQAVLRTDRWGRNALVMATSPSTVDTLRCVAAEGNADPLACLKCESGYGGVEAGSKSSRGEGSVPADENMIKGYTPGQDPTAAEVDANAATDPVDEHEGLLALYGLGSASANAEEEEEDESDPDDLSSDTVGSAGNDGSAPSMDIETDGWGAAAPTVPWKTVNEDGWAEYAEGVTPPLLKFGKDNLNASEGAETEGAGADEQQTDDHSWCDFIEVNASDITPAEFDKRFFSMQTPVMVRGGCADWPAQDSWTFDELRTGMLGRQEVRVATVP